MYAPEFDFGGRKVQGTATFGRADGTYAEHPALFLKSHAKEPNLPAPGPPTMSKVHVKPAVPTRDEKPVMGLTSNKNFITHNAVKAILLEPKKVPGAPMAYTTVSRPRTYYCLLLPLAFAGWSSSKTAQSKAARNARNQTIAIQIRRVAASLRRHAATRTHGRFPRRSPVAFGVLALSLVILARWPGAVGPHLPLR